MHVLHVVLASIIVLLQTRWLRKYIQGSNKHQICHKICNRRLTVKRGRIWNGKILPISLQYYKFQQFSTRLLQNPEYFRYFYKKNTDWSMKLVKPGTHFTSLYPLSATKISETNLNGLCETQIHLKKIKYSSFLPLTSSTVNSHQYNILSHYSLPHSQRQNEHFSLGRAEIKI